MCIYVNCREWLEQNRWHFLCSEIVGFTDDGEPCVRIDVLERQSGEKRFVLHAGNQCLRISQGLAEKLVDIFSQQIK